MNSDTMELIKLARKERVAVIKRVERGECDGMTSPKCAGCKHAFYCQDLKHTLPRLFFL